MATRRAWHPVLNLLISLLLTQCTAMQIACSQTCEFSCRSCGTEDETAKSLRGCCSVQLPAGCLREHPAYRPSKTHKSYRACCLRVFPFYCQWSADLCLSDCDQRTAADKSERSGRLGVLETCASPTIPVLLISNGCWSAGFRLETASRSVTLAFRLRRALPRRSSCTNRNARHLVSQGYQVTCTHPGPTACSSS